MLSKALSDSAIHSGEKLNVTGHSSQSHGTPQSQQRRLTPLPASPKTVVGVCNNCSEKLYSRYPTTMHIANYCNKGM